jgi:hypothetical protein
MMNAMLTMQSVLLMVVKWMVGVYLFKCRVLVAVVVVVEVEIETDYETVVAIHLPIADLDLVHVLVPVLVLVLDHVLVLVIDLVHVHVLGLLVTGIDREKNVYNLLPQIDVTIVEKSGIGLEIAKLVGIGTKVFVRIF